MLVGALVVAALAALLAPEPWPTGTGELLVRADGVALATSTVEVGTGTSVDLEGEADGRRVAATLPGGVPVDAPVTAHVRVTEDGVTVRPDLEDLALDLRLPNGMVEAIPVLRWDDDAGVVVATRRPPVHAATALALLAGAVVLWVTVAIPLFATAMLIPVVLAATGTSDPVAALAPFFNPIIALFFGGFLMAEGMRRVGLDRWAASRIVGVAGQGPVRLFAVLMGTAAFLSMWMSNTAAVAVLIPIALAVATPVGDDGFTRVLVLGTAYAATLGGVGSAIGTPANLLAIEFLDTFDVRSITFAGWFAFGLPMVVAFLPVVGGFLWWRHGVRVEASALADVREAVREHGGDVVLGWPQRRVLGIFGLVALTWLLEAWHGVHPGVVALGGVVALALTRDVREEDLGRINWSALLTFGGGLTLGVALTRTGVADWIASRLGGLAVLPDLAAVAVVATVTLVLTTVASNTASAATLVPLAIPLGALLGVDVTLLVVVVAIASSIDFALIIGTPPTMMAYATGLFTPGEILRRGAWLDVLGLAVLLTVVVAVWRALGLV